MPSYNGNICIPLKNDVYIYWYGKCLGTFLSTKNIWERQTLDSILSCM